MILRKSHVTKLPFLILLGLLAAFQYFEPISAQVVDTNWSEITQLSSEDGRASRAALLADQYGFVHAFWAEEYDDARYPVMMHAQFDGQAWSEPVDIFYVPDFGREMRFPAVTIDDRDRVHLIWVGSQQGPLYYSYADLRDVGSAAGWAAPLMINEPVFGGRLHVDPEGVLHLVYSSYFGRLPDQSPGLYYIRSEDDGLTWSESRWLDPDIRLQDAPQIMDLKVDSEGGMHLVWWYNNPEDGGSQDKPIRYAHSLDGGQSWAVPFTIDTGDTEGTRTTRAGSPILAINGNEVHVVWAGGTGTNRYHRYSTDQGVTWGPIRQIDAFGRSEGYGRRQHDF